MTRAEENACYYVSTKLNGIHFQINHSDSQLLKFKFLASTSNQDRKPTIRASDVQLALCRCSPLNERYLRLIFTSHHFRMYKIYLNVERVHAENGSNLLATQKTQTK